MKWVLFVALVLALHQGWQSHASSWNPQNDPSKWADGLVYDFSQLPLNGSLDFIPWSDTYWPSYLSGIAHRWNKPIPQDFEYKLSSKAQLQSMTPEQIASLSPAGAFLYFRGLD